MVFHSVCQTDVLMETANAWGLRIKSMASACRLGVPEEEEKKTSGKTFNEINATQAEDSFMRAAFSQS